MDVQAAQTQIQAIQARLVPLYASLPYADGLAYSQDKQAIAKLQSELQSLCQFIREQTHVTVVFPQWARDMRSREAQALASKKRVAAALGQLEKFFK